MDLSLQELSESKGALKLEIASPTGGNSLLEETDPMIIDSFSKVDLNNPKVNFGTAPKSNYINSDLIISDEQLRMNDIDTSLERDFQCYSLWLYFFLILGVLGIMNITHKAFIQTDSAVSVGVAFGLFVNYLLILVGLYYGISGLKHKSFIATKRFQHITAMLIFYHLLWYFWISFNAINIPGVYLYGPMESELMLEGILMGIIFLASIQLSRLLQERALVIKKVFGSNV